MSALSVCCNMTFIFYANLHLLFIMLSLLFCCRLILLESWLPALLVRLHTLCYTALQREMSSVKIR